MIHPRRLAVLAGLALAIAGTVWAWPDRRPNVLWITVDGLRPDRLSIFGYEGRQTPSIDQLAASGVAFEQAFTDTPWSGGASASAMTGRLAAHHGLRTPYQRLGSESTTVAEVFRAEGYATAAIVGSLSQDHVYGLDRGFAEYDDRYDSADDAGAMRPHMPSAFSLDTNRQRTFLTRKRRADSRRSDAAVGDAAVAWLKRASRMRPFFLWVHFVGPRAQDRGKGSPADLAERTRIEYDDKVAAVDLQVGRLLQELSASGLLERTVVILHGTYAEPLSADGLASRARLDDAALRVPLLIRWPARLAPARVAAVVRTVDAAPTLLGLLGMPGLPHADGESLEPLLAGISKERPPAIAESWLAAEGDFGMFNPDGTALVPGLWRRGVRTERWKYVRSDPVPFVNFDPSPTLPADAGSYRSERLFDLHAAGDGSRDRDVAAAHAEVVAELRNGIDGLAPLTATLEPAAE